MLADLGITPDRLAPLSYNCLRQREEDTVSHAIDFGELKQRVSIERAVEMLGIKLTKSGPQLRGPCPICKAGGDRAFVVTPAKGLFTASAHAARVAARSRWRRGELASFLRGLRHARNS